MNDNFDPAYINALLQKGDYRAALEALLPLDLSSRRLQDFLKLRADLAASYAHKEVALQDAEVLGRRKETRVDSQRVKIALYLNLRDYNKAKEHLKEVPATVRNSGPFQEVVARFFYETGSYAKVEQYCASIAEKHRSPAALDYWINANVVLGNYQQALETLQGQAQSEAKNRLAKSIAGLGAGAASLEIDKLTNSDTRIGIITPVGPGHEVALESCKRSIEKANREPGDAKFSIEHIVIDDTKAKIGRSRARNQGIEQAIEQQLDWLFFLDADDLLDSNFLAQAWPFLDEYDFIWGGIYSGNRGGPYHYRLNQLPCIDSIETLLEEEPFLTVQMGHFSRVELLKNHRIRFDESLDCGEDVKFYLEEASVGKIIKIPSPFFYNIRGEHSTGPRSATGGDWNRMSRQVIEEFRETLGQ